MRQQSRVPLVAAVCTLLVCSLLVGVGAAVALRPAAGTLAEAGRSSPAPRASPKPPSAVRPPARSPSAAPSSKPSPSGSPGPWSDLSASPQAPTRTVASPSSSSLL